MLSTTARLALLAATLGLAAPAFAQETTTEGTTDTTTEGTATEGTTDTGTTEGTTTDTATGDAATTDTATADAGAAPDLSGVSTAIDAATAAGLLETLTSGEEFTAFVPTNEALAAVQDAATDALADQTAAAELIQAYVIPGRVMAADAMSMVEGDGGTSTVDSLSGAPINLMMDGDTLTVNGAPVTQPDLMLGNVVIHVIDGVYLPTE